MGRKGSIGKARGGSRPAAVCDRQATPPADPSLPNPPGGGSFRLGLRWFGRNRPQVVCPAAHRLAQPRIPQPQDPSPYSDRLSSRNGSVRSVVLTEHSPGSYLGRVMSPIAPRLPCRTARRSVPTPEAVRGKERGTCHRLANLRRAPGVGRCLRQRRVCRAGPLGDRSLPQRRLLRFLGRMARGTRALPGWQRPGAAGEDSGQQARWFR